MISRIRSPKIAFRFGVSLGDPGDHRLGATGASGASAMYTVVVAARLSDSKRSITCITSG